MHKGQPDCAHVQKLQKDIRYRGLDSFQDNGCLLWNQLDRIYATCPVIRGSDCMHNAYICVQAMRDRFNCG